MELDLVPILDALSPADKHIYMDACVDDVVSKVMDFQLNYEESKIVFEKAFKELFDEK